LPSVGGKCLAGDARGDGEVLGEGDALGDGLGDGLGEGRGEGRGEGLGEALVRPLELDVGVRRFVGLFGGCPVVTPDELGEAVVFTVAAVVLLLELVDR